MSEAAAPCKIETTPHLDRLVPLPPPASDHTEEIAGVILGLGISVLLMWLGFTGKLNFVEQWLSRGLPDRIEHEGIARVIGSAAALLASAYFAAVLLHELGHVAAGAAAGLRFHLIRVGPVQIRRDRRVLFAWGPGQPLGGFAVMAPLTPERMVRRGAWMVAGGPAANLASALLAVPISLSGNVWATTFVVISSFFGLSNLLPFRLKSGLISDGLFLWFAFRCPARAERRMALYRFSAESLDGRLERPLPAEFIAIATAIHDNSLDTLLVQCYLMESALLEEKSEEAVGSLEVCLTLSGFAPPELHVGLIASAAILQARECGRRDIAELWLSDIADTARNFWLRAPVEIAILKAAEDVEALIEKLDAVETAVRKGRFGAQREGRLNLLHAWKLEAEAHQQSLGAESCDALAPMA